MEKMPKRGNNEIDRQVPILSKLEEEKSAHLARRYFQIHDIVDFCSGGGKRIVKESIDFNRSVYVIAPGSHVLLHFIESYSCQRFLFRAGETSYPSSFREDAEEKKGRCVKIAQMGVSSCNSGWHVSQCSVNNSDVTF